MSGLLLRTLRDDPADAETDSHRLLVRAGYIRRVSAGIYAWLPLGWRVLRQIEQIVREEMDRAGAQELLLPIPQPLELWQRSGRDAATRGAALAHDLQHERIGGGILLLEALLDLGGGRGLHADRADVGGDLLLPRGAERGPLGAHAGHVVRDRLAHADAVDQGPAGGARDGGVVQARAAPRDRREGDPDARGASGKHAP